jgi:hypothetical protein
MYTKPVVGAAPGYMATPLPQRTPPASLNSLRDVSNVAHAAAATAERESTPIERQLRAAMGLRWALFLGALQKTPEAVAVAGALVGCVEAGRMPVPADLQLWDQCFGPLYHTPPGLSAQLATASGVRTMLGSAPANVRIANAHSQGVWIRVGMMAAALWPKQFGQRVEPLQAVWQSLGDAISHLLACNNASDINRCARQLAGLAEYIRTQPGPLPAGLAAYGRDLDAAVAVAGNKNDDYYKILGGQLTNLGMFDELTFDDVPLPQLR